MNLSSSSARTRHNWFWRGIDFLTDAMAVLAAVLLLALAVMICVSVLLRYYFSKPVAWTTELSEYFLFISTLLGAAWVLRRNGHVIVDLLVQKASPAVQRALLVITNLVGAATCLIFTYHGVLATQEAYVRNINMIKIMSIPKYYLLIFIPLGMVMLSFQFLRKAGEALYPDPVPEVGSEGEVDP